MSSKAEHRVAHAGLIPAAQSPRALHSAPLANASAESRFGCDVNSAQKPQSMDVRRANRKLTPMELITAQNAGRAALDGQLEIAARQNLAAERGASSVGHCSEKWDSTAGL